jgi:signal transduction histidine kinase
VAQEIERCRPLVEGKPVEITFELQHDVCVRAHHDLVAIAIGNLLRNACYFTQRGCVCVMLESNGLVVADTGPGVPEPVRSRLFEPFVQGHDALSIGSGLGLSIVKRVAEHLGWSIRLDDVAPMGSRFTLMFGPGVTT